MDDNLDVKRLIKQHYRDMIAESSIDKVSVSALCKKACISRTTFYSYYKDKHHVLEDIVYEDFAAKVEQTYPVFVSVHSEIVGNPSSLLLVEIMLQSIYEKRSFYLPLAQTGKSKPLARALSSSSKKLRMSISGSREVKSDEKSRYASIHDSSSTTAIILEWLRNGADVPPKQIAEWICEWNQASFKSVK